MMQHQDGDGCRKCFLWKRQSRRVPLQHRSVRALAALRKPRSKSVVILDARHPPGAFPQLFCRRARPRANFKNVFAQIRTRQKPRNYLLPRHAPPVRRSTKPVLKPIQSNTSRPPRGRVSRKVLKEELFFQDLIIAGLRTIWLSKKGVDFPQ